MPVFRQDGDARDRGATTWCRFGRAVRQFFERREEGLGSDHMDGRAREDVAHNFSRRCRIGQLPARRGNVQRQAEIEVAGRRRRRSNVQKASDLPRKLVGAAMSPRAAG